VNAPRSLEAALLLRLGLVLTVAFAVIAGWFALHVSEVQERHTQLTVHEVMGEFFVHIAWTVPLILAVTLALAAITLRRSFAPLRSISARAAQIRPDALDQRLPEAGVPSEVLPLVRGTNEMLDRVEAGFARQRRFTANVAHELRTPLQLLAAGLEAFGPDKRIEPLRDDVKRISRLVTQLLEVSRLDARIEPVLGTADLGKIAAETLAALAPLAVARGATVALERPEGPVTVRGEAVLIGDLMRNLFENAISVSPDGAEVTVVVDAGGKLEVIDRGPGIAPEHRQRVFERFWRAPGAPYGGSGLGLAIVKEIADICAARIGIADAAGGGACVSVAFDCCEEAGPIAVRTRGAGAFPARAEP
jgi:signal transduction histidine kinase